LLMGVAAVAWTVLAIHPLCRHRWDDMVMMSFRYLQNNLMTTPLVQDCTPQDLPNI
jgi:hypothetical protein